VPVADGAYPISWAIASLPWSKYHPYLKGIHKVPRVGLREGIRH
jgi:hypothetical protein